MLEKNENIFYFDAHFHLADCLDLNTDSRVKPGNDKELHGLDTLDGLSLSAHPVSLSGLTRQSLSNTNWTACSCSHSIEEWNVCHAELVSASHATIVHSYGLHPQSAGHINIKENLEQLLQQKKLHAIGEAGFDYFTQDFRDQANLQEEMFNLQLNLALQYNMPMVIHARKANHKLFEYSRQFKKLPAVLFHSFMGPAREARSLIDHGINAYFSFGKQIMNNNKKVLDCAKNLPLKNLLLETDAPFQYLKGESFTSPQDITKIYDAFMGLRDEGRDDVFNQLRENFLELYDN